MAPGNKKIACFSNNASARLRDGWRDLPCIRKERFTVHIMDASPTMTLFLFQIAMLAGESLERPKNGSAETYMRSMISSDEEAKVVYANI